MEYKQRMTYELEENEKKVGMKKSAQVLETGHNQLMDNFKNNLLGVFISWEFISE